MSAREADDGAAEAEAMEAGARNDLLPSDRDLVGQWLDTGNRIEGDGVCARIEWLIANRLERVAADGSGGGVLYRDPRDGRLWELTRPHGAWYGGGPPRLTLVAPASAAARYDLRGQ